MSLPLSCGGDDDDTAPSAGKGGKAGKGGSAGKSGSAGKGGSSGAPTAGKGGSAGKGGTGGTGGTTAGTGGTTAGTGGTTGGTGGIGTSGGGAGGEPAGAGGVEPGGAGQGGAEQGGAGQGGAAPSDPDAATRLAAATSICAKPASSSDTSCGNETACVAYYTDTTGFDDACKTNLTNMLTCMEPQPASDFECGPNFIAIDGAASAGSCYALWQTWQYCLPI